MITHLPSATQSADGRLYNYAPIAPFWPSQPWFPLGSRSAAGHVGGGAGSSVSPASSISTSTAPARQDSTVVNSRLEDIGIALRSQGVGQATIATLQQAWERSTVKNYDVFWRGWSEFAQITSRQGSMRCRRPSTTIVAGATDKRQGEQRGHDGEGQDGGALDMEPHSRRGGTHGQDDKGGCQDQPAEVQG